MSVELSRILVTGGEGMIGRVLPFGVKLSQRELDVRSPEDIERALERHQPSAIVHLAALDIRQAEADPLAAYATNVLGSYHVACAARRRSIPLVFLSSGAVFNGDVGAVHGETAPPDPVNIFGQTKWLAEILLRETLEDLLIIRTGWVFGGHQAYHRKFVDVALELALRGEPIQATVDQWGSPTFVHDLVGEIRRLLLSGVYGTVHVVNAGAASGMDIAREIVRVTGSRSELLEVKGVDLPNPGPRRPASEVLVSRRVRLRPWGEALREYVLARVGVRAGAGE